MYMGEIDMAFGIAADDILNIYFIFMPPPTKAGVGHIVFHYDVTSVRAYVKFVTRV